MILGLTGWATLCWLVRGETPSCANSNTCRPPPPSASAARIMAKHIAPNVMRTRADHHGADSDLILYEAVLTYVGVGVDPMNSFGRQRINLAPRMSRDPVVWWSFAAAFGFMVTLVLAANLFADGVRDAFDLRPARAQRAPCAPCCGAVTPEGWTRCPDKSPCEPQGGAGRRCRPGARPS